MSCVIGACGDFTPELQDFFHRVDGHVARSGNDCTLALNVMALRGQHLLHEIDLAKTRGLRARTGTAIDKAFSGQNARFITIGDALVLAEHITDFTPAYADVPSRHVRIFAQVAVPFIHEGLAERSAEHTSDLHSL